MIGLLITELLITGLRKSEKLLRSLFLCAALSAATERMRFFNLPGFVREPAGLCLAVYFIF
jgi:hypothetical protein